MLKKICGIILGVSFFGCAGAPKLTPHKLDLQLMSMREFEVVDKKTLNIQLKEIHRITNSVNSYGHGFFCVPWAEALEWRKYCLDNECTTPKVPQLSEAPQ